jgi:hypothetical protein
MTLTDTHPDSQAFADELLRQMPPEQKLRLIFSAYETGKQLAKANLRLRYPQTSEPQIQDLWAREHLGPELFEQVYGKQTANRLPR